MSKDQKQAQASEKATNQDGELRNEELDKVSGGAAQPTLPAETAANIHDTSAPALIGGQELSSAGIDKLTNPKAEIWGGGSGKV